MLMEDISWAEVLVLRYNMMIIDLTYPLGEGMLKYPSDPEFAAEAVSSQNEWVESGKDGFSGFKTNSGYMNLMMRNHHGTHIDAPAHKTPGGKTIDTFPLDRFVNRAVLIDISDVASRESKAVTVDDVSSRIDYNYLWDYKISALIFYTGFCDLIAKHDGNLDLAEKIQFERGFTYFSPDAAQYVLDTTTYINLVGIDSFSFDPSGSKSESHKIFLGKKILLLEALVNLDMLRKAAGGKPFYLVSLPLLIKGADAAPCRAYAEIMN
ncbi:MAG: cyclase family protein [Candidatus Woesearchaeota archaeon]